MKTLQQIAMDVGRIMLAIFGTAFVLIFASGVIAAATEAADVGEAVIGVVVALVVAPLAAWAISYVLLPSLRQLSTAWSAALDGQPTASSLRYNVLLGVTELLSAMVVVVFGALRYRHGVSTGEEHWAQQGALILVGALVLGGGSSLGRFVAAARATPGKGRDKGAGRSGAADLHRAEARSVRGDDGRRLLAFCLGLGLTLAMSVSAIPGGTP